MRIHSDLARSQVVDFVKHARGGFKLAMLGDSITDQNSRNISPPSASPSRAWFTDGWMTWTRILTRQRFDIDPAGDFGVSGDTLQMMLARLPSVIAYAPTHCTVLGGSNNFDTDTFATIRDTWLSIVTGLINAGIAPIVIPAPPRGGTFLTAAQVQLQHRFTNFQREWCRANRGAYFVDYLPLVTDQTSAVSIPIAGFLKSGDTLHQAAIGAYWMSIPVTALLSSICPALPTEFSAAADYYHATDNPTGNLLFSGTANRALLVGTDGTQTANAGLTYAGGSALATGATFLRGTSTSTCTVTLSKENPRTDTGRASGERQIIEIAATSGGGADEIYNLRFTPTFSNISSGDWYYGEASVEIITAPVNMMALEFHLLETRPSNSQTAMDMALNTSTAGVMPTVVWSGVLRTPPIQRTADATAVQANIRARMKTDAGAASVKFAVGDMQVRKVAV
jgi:putative NIF3 family GTP cyclohydrolase 1 type 2